MNTLAHLALLVASFWLAIYAFNNSGMNEDAIGFVAIVIMAWAFAGLCWSVWRDISDIRSRRDE